MFTSKLEQVKVSLSDDKPIFYIQILAYISENKRYEDTGGNAMWIAMAERKIVKNRSWESMKERFKKVEIFLTIEYFIDFLSLLKHLVFSLFFLYFIVSRIILFFI